MTRADEAEPQSINDCSASHVWSTSMFVGQTITVSAPWNHNLVPTFQMEEGEVPTEGDTCQSHLADFSTAGTGPQPFRFQTMNVFPTSLSASLVIENG